LQWSDDAPDVAGYIFVIDYKRSVIARAQADPLYYTDNTLHTLRDAFWKKKGEDIHEKNGGHSACGPAGDRGHRLRLGRQ
jgi:hypothetical protein